ncbi:hypothetical protein GCM10023217_14930 [Gordonia alkaliphila]|uniref:Uncharacterized protein n=2 Tax=Gordonia alkaliphila TaxID=1053547 RepID=A0ABP8Z4F0_9ACTN
MLPTVLWDGASNHAQLACKLHPGSEGWDAQQLAISIGTSVELLIKHMLAQRSFNLLADRFSDDTALTLDGKASKSVSLPPLTTVTAAAAFDRAKRVCNLNLVKSDYDIVFEVRNAALHLGIASEHANTEALKKMAALAGEIFDHLGVSRAKRSAYWGGAAAHAFVESLVDEAADEVRARYDWLLSVARSNYEQLVENLVGSGKESVVRQFAEVRPTIDPIAEESVPQQCPACRNMGWIVYAVDRSSPIVEYADEEYGYRLSETYVERDGIADRFECGVCRLKLSRREYLVQAKMPMETTLEPDGATEQEISDYADAQIERYIESMDEQARGN